MPSLQDLQAKNVEYSEKLIAHEDECRNFALALHRHFHQYLGADNSSLWFDDVERPEAEFPREAPQSHPFSLMSLDDDGDLKFKLILKVDGHFKTTWYFPLVFIVKRAVEQFVVGMPATHSNWNIARMHQGSPESFRTLFDAVTRMVMEEMTFGRRRQPPFGFRSPTQAGPHAETDAGTHNF